MKAALLVVVFLTFLTGATAPAQAPSPTPADRSEVEKKIVALSNELKNPTRDARKILSELFNEFEILDKTMGSDPRSRVPLLPQRWQLLLALEKAHYWPQMIAHMNRFRLVARISQQNRPAWEAEPMIETGLDAAAEKGLAVVAKAFPQDPEVDLWKAALSEKRARWSQALAEASTALAKAKPGSNVALPAVTAKAYFYKYHALLYLGKLPEAEIALNQALALDNAAAEFLQGQRVLAFAELNKLVVSDNYQPKIPLGIYHLFASNGGRSLAGSVCGFKLTTLTPSPRPVRMSVEIPEVTQAVTQDIVLLPGKTATLLLTPPLKSIFDPSALRADRPANLVVNIIDQASNSLLFNESYPVKLLPFDSLPFTIKTSQNTHPLRFEFMGAWVTPNSPAIEQFLTAAKARAPRRTFDGPQSASLPQVKAMFDELKSTGVSYVMDPTIFSGLDLIQRTRFPREVLASHNAQCVESTVLFASLLEAIGLEPYIVRVPGHAFVGWEPTKKDYATPGTLYYLETTAVSWSSFENAMDRAAETAESNKAAFKIPNSGSVILKVSDLRRAGITPQPYQ